MAKVSLAKNPKMLKKSIDFANSVFRRFSFLPSWLIFYRSDSVFGWIKADVADANLRVNIRHVNVQLARIFNLTELFRIE